MGIDARFARRIHNVAPDRRPIGDRIGIRPGAKGVSQRVHVGIRAHARKSEQIPGAADDIARLENSVRRGRTAALQMDGGPYTRESRADDQNIERLNHRYPSVSGLARLVTISLH
jgi:hypothetical protein